MVRGVYTVIINAPLSFFVCVCVCVCVCLFEDFCWMCLQGTYSYTIFLYFCIETLFLPLPHSPLHLSLPPPVCVEWSKHTREYYECSRYQSNPKVGQEKSASARIALKKYLFYYERVLPPVCVLLIQ